MGRNSNRRKKKASSGVGAWRPLASYKPLTSQRAAREITSQFHLVTRELDVAKQALADARSKKDKGSPSEAGISIADAQANVLKLTEKLESIGGRERYQQASVLLTDKNKSSSKWVFSTLTKLGLRPKSGETRPKTLEIGAINTQILSCPWLDVTSIDIEARAARIIEQDFFELELIREKWDVLVNAMVINCVPTKQLRGRMLVLCNLHLKLDAHLFMVLPLRCLSNSPFMSVDGFPVLLKAVGFEVVQQHQSPKIAFFCLAKRRQLSVADLQSLERMYPLHATAPSGKKQQRARKQVGASSDMKNDFAVGFDAESLRPLLKAQVAAVQTKPNSQKAKHMGSGLEEEEDASGGIGEIVGRPRRSDKGGGGGGEIVGKGLPAARRRKGT